MLLLNNHQEPMSGPVLLTSTVFRDDRGFFMETWNENRFVADLIQNGWSEQKARSIHFCQDNHSQSRKGVIRGLHYQLHPEPQGKLVRCSVGEIFDVIVDLRLDSKSFGRWASVILSDTNHQQLWIPVGFAHGFLALTDFAEIQYKTTGFWNSNCERTIRWNDPNLAIDWPIQQAPSLSIRDETAFTLADAVLHHQVFL